NNSPDDTIFIKGEVLNNSMRVIENDLVSRFQDTYNNDCLILMNNLDNYRFPLHTPPFSFFNATNRKEARAYNKFYDKISTVNDRNNKVTLDNHEYIIVTPNGRL